MNYLFLQRYVARHNVKFNLDHIRDLYEDIKQQIDDNNEWKRFVQHAQSKEKKWWEAGFLADTTCEPVVINVMDDEEENACDTEAEIKSKTATLKEQGRHKSKKGIKL